MGKLPALRIFGKDYDTRDGTGVRDFIHVMDLAEGHVAALEMKSCMTVNLGTGRGYSVLEVVDAFRRASGKEIATKFVGRRPGDVGSCYADSSRAQRPLGWKAKLGLDQMCADAWRWQSKNPAGYP